MKSVEQIIDSIARNRKLFIAALIFVFLAQGVAAFSYGLSVGRNQILCYLAVTANAPNKTACEAVSWLIRDEPPKAGKAAKPQ